jgi:hypothetical protein
MSVFSILPLRCFARLLWLQTALLQVNDDDESDPKRKC